MKKTRRKCKYCKEWYEPKFKTTEPCPNQECRDALYEAMKPKIVKAIVTMRKKEIKETDHQKYLQTEVQEIARLIDYKCLCLARNIIPIKKNGGHVFTNAANKNFAMNLHNIFLQSAQSNGSQKDDGLMRDGVARVFGEDYLSYLVYLKQTPIMKYNNMEYKQLREKAREIINELKSANKTLIAPRTPLERIKLRNWANEKLYIYPIQFCIYPIKRID